MRFWDSNLDLSAISTIKIGINQNDCSLDMWFDQQKVLSVDLESHDILKKELLEYYYEDIHITGLPTF